MGWWIVAVWFVCGLWLTMRAEGWKELRKEGIRSILVVLPLSVLLTPIATLAGVIVGLVLYERK